ncbi:MAG: chromosome partitioning protein ParB [Desulfobacterales bacterium CG23_combo_of_CG06-09_8_20_14_all_52_9]|nr:MAG: chromosome partitioning protein ParB [Desulfobacterales bacterium CG23_combo_of_CG06-09_8_20_14_all_52_9]
MKTSNNPKGSEPGGKKSQKIALGRGLDALFPDLELVETEKKGYFLCDMDLIHPNRFQPRVLFSETELAELSKSIKEKGVIQPIVVRKDEPGYEIVAGERRFRAAKMAGLSQIPAMLMSIKDDELLEMSIVENIQRENLNPVEEAEAYHRLMTQFHLTQEQVSERVGKNRSTVANFLRLRLLPGEIRDYILKGELSMGHARALLGANPPARQIQACRQVLAKKLSVRQTEAMVRRMQSASESPTRRVAKTDDSYFSDLADGLSRHFGTRVQIKRQGHSGKIEIDFYTDEDLDRLLGMLKSATL